MAEQENNTPINKPVREVALEELDKYNQAHPDRPLVLTGGVYKKPHVRRNKDK